ncbi:MAG: pirin [Tenericutes bacterium HGW-Tenericutes-1]|jgi:hypothetical protein|nr:MAG: pirin [Tenericutes bacterium HGW-Tenericutes-1]
MNKNILKLQKIGFQWPMENPFIFCAHHHDFYPEGNEQLGPNVSLKGRDIGSDFSNKNGFSMYHGDVVPGFPAHPHRGFETVTIVLEGVVDHFDSKGAKGRYGNGDVQWLTTGKGCQHAEMFPLINQDKPNTLELFQIWLNLPAKDKFVEPDYKMLWNEFVPVVISSDSHGNKTEIRVIAGELMGQKADTPNQASWASNLENHVKIQLIKMDSNANYVIPKSSKSINRNLYFYQGEDKIIIDGTEIAVSHRIKLVGDEDIIIQNGSKASYLLLLEAEPINEPVFQYGPFVMTTKDEVVKAYQDYQETQFGGWPWKRYDPVNEAFDGRFAQYSDGRIEKPKQ